MKIMSVVGARPQFVKLAPIAKAISETEHEHIIVHTGQHYDPLLSDIFFRDLGIPAPDAHLGIGSGSHGVQTGAILARMDEVLEQFSPDCVLVYGDTNSTLAATLSAVKLHYPVAHLEAGLRSFNRDMPEEHNRVLTDHASDICLAPTEVAREHLTREGLANRTVVVGDVMTDVLYEVRNQVESADQAAAIADLQLPDSYYLATIHRAENTDSPERLREIVTALSNADKPVVLLAHPRLRAKAAEQALELEQGSIVLRDSLAYPQLIAAALGSSGIATDSGGLQKEAFLLRVPCTTMRRETEWVETVQLGWNVLANSTTEILAALTRPAPQPTTAAPYGDGHAARRVVEVLSERIPLG
ncbi:UDP-N-acetylglucosamine 2-epimerase (non-hydrolyzing) [Leucobacter sp. UT-8R-CII-1-4]|uniref:non-hydrolyzing UDP-N-acetylglucosamine 2-epimerase n=1 Tax=Leucobacter sp. UT-8R-CII-1-4 TaxID=3040075 RepID=UPI0024A90353|nr:UDP-N-acetylglucosamine 2-epimerase (non-hydrolyzing) [Leucobacter sp. UT-8R-CII-1-4]MDI6023755.1 UDP-N-acetylglucosamine 2-epimerase (non-hydrolyzing) [Leucobacter sp. UT-8R-CII-1-4]